MAPAISRNDTMELMKSPTGKDVFLIWKPIEEKSGLPTTAETRGVSRSLVRAVITPPKAAPTTTPTAMSTTFPRRMNFFKSSSIASPPSNSGGRHSNPGQQLGSRTCEPGHVKPRNVGSAPQTSGRGIGYARGENRTPVMCRLLPTASYWPQASAQVLRLAQEDGAAGGTSQIRIGITM